MAQVTGGCRCGQLRYEVRGPLGGVVNCHCRFCRRVHGAAFTTVTFIGAQNFVWQTPPERAARYQTPLGSVRHFCGVCASPIFNLSRELELGGLVTNSLDGEQPAPWAHLNVESKLPWLVIGDSLPQFQAFPRPAELVELYRRHPDAWRPERLLGGAK
jgi:hypothetical protein